MAWSSMELRELAKDSALRWLLHKLSSESVRYRERRGDWPTSGIWIIQKAEIEEKERDEWDRNRRRVTGRQRESRERERERERERDWAGKGEAKILFIRIWLSERLCNIVNKTAVAIKHISLNWIVGERWGVERERWGWRGRGGGWRGGGGGWAQGTWDSAGDQSAVRVSDCGSVSQTY